MDWTVAASRFEGVSFPQSGSYYPRGGFTQTIAGARRGTILAIPNAGAAPRATRGPLRPRRSVPASVERMCGDARRRSAGAFGPTPRTSGRSTQRDRRTIVNYRAPTVKRGVLPQRIVADRRADARIDRARRRTRGRTIAWAQEVGGGTMPSAPGVTGRYLWHRYVPRRLRVEQTLGGQRGTPESLAALDPHPPGGGLPGTRAR